MLGAYLFVLLMDQLSYILFSNNHNIFVHLTHVYNLGENVGLFPGILGYGIQVLLKEFFVALSCFNFVLHQLAKT